MAARKMGDLPKFIATFPGRGVREGYILAEGETDERPIAQASTHISRNRETRPVGIYQLVKIVRPKEIPVDVTEVSCCKPVEKKGK